MVLRSGSGDRASTRVEFDLVRERYTAMGLGPQLVLETTRIGDHDVVVATGEIDLASAPRVEVALEPFVGQPVVFDLRGVEFMDSAGLKVLLQQRSRIQESGATETGRL